MLPGGRLSLRLRRASASERATAEQAACFPEARPKKPSNKMDQPVIELSDGEDDAPPPPARARAAAAAASSHDAIEILSDDDNEHDASVGPPGRGGGTSTSSGANVSQAIELDDDDVQQQPLAAASSGKRRRQEEGASASSGAACGLCSASSLSSPFRLAECSHRFCRACLTTYVQKRLRRVLASDVVCPTCQTGLSISDVQSLSGAAERGDAAPPPPSYHGLPAHMVAALQRSGVSAAHLGLAGPSSRSEPVGGRRVGTSVATKRLMKELQAITKAPDQGFSVSLPDESDLYTWDAAFYGFDRGSPLEADLRRAHTGGRIELRISFPSQYPSAPPYVRVLRPRFAFRTGHVTIGGSICTEMLTSVGWSSTMTVESVLVGIRANMLVGGARLDLSNKRDYSEAEAQEAFHRMVREHGWH